MNLNNVQEDTCPVADTALRFPASISVFFPAFNDAPALPSLLASTFDVLRQVAADYEVIVVNDGSADDTAQVLEQLRCEYHPFLRVVTHEQNRGYGAALRTGFANCSKEFIFYTDGDGQYDPSELPDLLRAVTPDTGLVNGYKIERQDPWHRIAIGWLYNRFARCLFQIKLRDIDCDFRLIRASALNPCDLRATSGVICVELVRALELSGWKVAERPVHHYPRLHGRSQFFRVQSLATTFLQLWATFARLIILQALWRTSHRFAAACRPFADKPPSTRLLHTPEGSFLSLRGASLVFGLVTILSVLAYARALQLPFIADDYVQIELARNYGPVSGWPALATDALYRCRATSLVLTYWTERGFGLDPVAFNVSSLLLHIVNGLLVFALGMWRPIGWRLSAVAACFFAVSQRHQEAVMWYAAVPELLVFCFALASFLSWVHWLQSEKYRVPAYVAALGFFLLALLSKESGVVVAPLLVLAVLSHRSRPLKRLWSVLPFAALCGIYFALAFLSRKTHLHFHDGTFSLHAPFVLVLIHSATKLLEIWGAIALVALGVWKAWHWRSVISIAAAWIVITLVPYSFLTYMPTVPSRHTYFASVGLALIVAASLVTFHERAASRNRQWALRFVVALIVVQQCGYLWTKKQHQFEARAEPTERLVRLARKADKAVYVKCFPYDISVAELALQYRLTRPVKPRLIMGALAAGHADAVDLCRSSPGLAGL